MTGLTRIHAVVTGRVQGVGFRWATLETAERLGLAGWVRNRADGSVELEAQGSPAALDQLRAFLAEGPSWARVDGVAVEERAVREGDAGFTVR
ncbi:acylphosphatase [Schumannella sp. 10F1B-5-1]|uniref:acylphosphatase n=1 Tax=Schumannella sp. 10F1B-5-1 TaxID=2590780 RepID=UPI001130CB5A|nr:acylphosphatase [Schumannella sp. 10F1B-5-1]TPW70768.1 acylphosphatase [Schumannella sp. 10F1B-5-1]